MRLTVYVYLMFGFAIAGYFFGMTSLVTAMIAAQGTTPLQITDIINKLIQEITVNATMQSILGTIGIGIAIATLMTAFSAPSIIAIGVLLVVLNLFVFPFSFVIDPSMPDAIKIPVVLLFNLLTMLTVVSFITGKD